MSIWKSIIKVVPFHNTQNPMGRILLNVPEKFSISCSSSFPSTTITSAYARTTTTMLTHPQLSPRHNVPPHYTNPMLLRPHAGQLSNDSATPNSTTARIRYHDQPPS